MSESFIQRKIHIQENSSKGLKYVQRYDLESCMIQIYLANILLIIWALFIELKTG